MQRIMTFKQEFWKRRLKQALPLVQLYVTVVPDAKLYKVMPYVSSLHEIQTFVISKKASYRQLMDVSNFECAAK
jgi:hypothetical protein